MHRGPGLSHTTITLPTTGTHIIAAGTEPNARGGHNIIGKLRRWNITHNSEDCEPDQDNAGSISKITSRSKNTETALIAALKGNYLFSELTEGDLEQMTGAMSRVCKQPGDIVIRQGHKGTEFFILEKGHADVRVDNILGERGLATCVFVCVCKCGGGCGCGCVHG